MRPPKQKQPSIKRVFPELEHVNVDVDVPCSIWRNCNKRAMVLC